MLFPRLAVAVSVALASTMSACSCEPPEQALPKERVDSGFSMELNAFSFENFGGVDRDSRLNEDLLVRLHGKDAICAAEEANCRIKPIAKEYMKAVNNAMKGGRCEGFALLSGLLFAGEIDAAELGGNVAAGMRLEDNEPLGREIAYWFSTQYLRDVVAQSTEALGAEAAVRFLTQELSKEAPAMYRLGIVRIDEGGDLTGGHAVLPIAVGPGEGEGRYIIYVYDNNHPSEEREIHVDTATGEWSYHAATNPDEEGALYLGNRDNGNLLYLSPLKPRLGRHACSFCSDENGEASLQQVFGSAGVELSAANEAGQTTGEKDGKVVSDIPGSAAIPVFSADLWTDDTGVQSFVPTDGELTITIQPSGTDEQSGEQTVVMLASGTVVMLDGFTVEEGQEAVLTIDTETGTVNYAAPAGSTGGGTITFGSTNEDGSEVVVSVELPAGTAAASITVDPDTGNPSIQVDAEGEEQVTIHVTVSDEDGESTFTGQAPVSSGGSTTLLLDQWQGEGDDIGAEVDTDGDGTSDSSVSLADAGEEPVPPVAPTNLSATVVGDNSIALTWTDNATTEASFEVERSDGAGFTRIATLGSNVTSYTDTGLAAASFYRYRVRALNVHGASRFSNIVGRATPTCDPATKLVDGACVACVAGEYCPGGSAPAATCAAGSWDHDSDPATPCSNCAEGEYCAGGTNGPVACAAGEVDHDNSAATACVACTAGQYCAGGAVDAITCGGGEEDDDSDPATPCVDVDECAAATHDCDPAFETCQNEVGTGWSCIDIDECAAATDDCDPVFETCQNEVGTGWTCIDVDECAFNNGECGDPAFVDCVDNVSAPPTCLDIDECAAGTHDCDVQTETCNNELNTGWTCLARGPVWAAVTTGNSGNDMINGLCLDGQRNVISAGGMTGNNPLDFGNGVIVTPTNTLNMSWLVVKHDENGVAQWGNTVLGAGTGDTRSNGVACDPLGAVYAVGHISGGTATNDFGNGVTYTNTGVETGVLVKYDASGLAQWVKTVTTPPGNYSFRHVVVDSAGSIIVLGNVSNGSAYDFGDGQVLSAGFAGWFFARFTDNGASATTQSVQRVNTTNNGFDALADMEIDAADNIYITGHSFLSNDFGNAVTTTMVSSGVYPFVVEYDATLTAQRAMQTVSAHTANVRSGAVDVDAAGNIYLSGWIETTTPAVDFGNGVVDPGSASGNAFLVRYDPAGVAQSVRSIVATQRSQCDQNGCALEVEADGTIYWGPTLQGAATFDVGDGVTVTTVNGGSNWALVRITALDGATDALTVNPAPFASSVRRIVVDDTGAVYVGGHTYGVNQTFGFGNGVNAISGGSNGDNFTLVQYRF